MVNISLLASVLVAGLPLAACGSSSTTGGGNAAAINACGLLSMGEIQQATGAAMGSGLLQTTDTQASCDWNAVDDSSGTSAVGVIVQDFDATLWQNLASSPHATPVMGIGEKAFKGYPHAGDLSVKQGAYEVDVGIIDFKHDPATVDAAALDLMTLVLSRV